MTSIPGIGAQTVNVLLTEIPDWPVFDSAKQLASYAGLNPEERTSGTSIKGKERLSCKGNPRLRKALDLPEIVAKRFNRLIAAFCTRLLDPGKSKMQVIGAAMRKLLHIAFGVMKPKKIFAPNYLNLV